MVGVGEGVVEEAGGVVGVGEGVVLGSREMLGWEKG